MKNDTSRALLYRLWRAYRLRWKRRYFILRAIRRRGQLASVEHRTHLIRSADILCFSTVRNEIERIDHFLTYHRNLGVSHFLIVDNGSTDGTAEFLRSQPDVSLWQSAHSYKLSRFGVDWLTWLHFRYGHGHWCLTLDADELLLPPFAGKGVLVKLTRWLEREGARTVPALMLDLYPQGPLGGQPFRPGDDPLTLLCWFDPGGIDTDMRPELQSRLQRGGVRGRKFFADAPERAPTLSKLPLVRWNRRFAYLTSTHSALPPKLNRPDVIGLGRPPQAIILHTKFLPTIVAKSREEKARQQHFSNSRHYDAYYEELAQDPTLWTSDSVRLEGWEQLQALGLMTKGDWDGT